VSQAQSTPQELPASLKSYNITTYITIRHIFEGDTYSRTLFHVEVCGEATIEDRRIVFPCRISERAHNLAHENPLKLVIEDILYEQFLMYSGIVNYAKRREEIIRELQKYGQVVEEYAQDYDESSEDDSDP
jgi:hypothetical protein